MLPELTAVNESTGAESVERRPFHEDVKDTCLRYLTEWDIDYIIAETPSKDPNVITCALLLAMVERRRERTSMGDEDSVAREWNSDVNGLFYDNFDHHFMIPTCRPMMLDPVTGVALAGPSKCPDDEDYFMRRKYPGPSPFPQKRLFSERDND